MTRFDLLVLGTGAAGSSAAHRCRKAGWNVAVVDDQPYGGTCALRGCDPKKVFVGAVEFVDWQRRMAANGVVGESRIDWPALMRFKRSFTDPVPARDEAGFQDAGIATYHGRARFSSESQLVVESEVLETKHVLIATGARPTPLRIPGEEYVRTSTDFLELDELPERIAFIGAGYVSFEFAHVAQRAGSSSIILGRGAPLKRFDADVAASLVDHTRSIGIDVRVGTTVTAVETDSDRAAARERRAHGSAGTSGRSPGARESRTDRELVLQSAHSRTRRHVQDSRGRGDRSLARRACLWAAGGGADQRLRTRGPPRAAHCIAPTDDLRVPNTGSDIPYML